jgi:hypothetical protein
LCANAFNKNDPSNRSFDLHQRRNTDWSFISKTKKSPARSKKPFKSKKPDHLKSSQYEPKLRHNKSSSKSKILQHHKTKSTAGMKLNFSKKKKESGRTAKAKSKKKFSVANVSSNGTKKQQQKKVFIPVKQVALPDGRSRSLGKTTSTQDKLNLKFANKQKDLKKQAQKRSQNRDKKYGHHSNQKPEGKARYLQNSGAKSPGSGLKTDSLKTPSQTMKKGFLHKSPSGGQKQKRQRQKSV